MTSLRRISLSAEGLPDSIVWVKSEDVYGDRIDFGTIPSLVKYLNRDDALLALAKISWLLEKWGDTNRELQVRLAQLLIEDRHLDRAINLIAGHQVLFFRAQLYILAKYLILYGRIQARGEFGKREMEVLGKGLLGTNNLIDSVSRQKSRRLQHDQDLTGVVHNLATTSFYMRNVHHGLNITRAKYLYVCLHRKLNANPPKNFVDIERVFQEATGIALEDYLNVGIAIITHYRNFYEGPQELSKEFAPAVFRPRRYFNRTRLDPKKLDRIMETISMTPADLVEDIKRQSRRERAYDFLSLRAHPLLKLADDEYVLVSFSYLVERLTTGVYWIIFDHLKRESGKKWHLFSSYNGRIFEEYVKERAAEIFDRSHRAGDRLAFDQAYVIGKKQFNTPDVMIFSDETAVLIEASATRLQARRMTSLGLIKAFEEDCQKILFENARSLDTFIGNVAARRVDTIDGFCLRKIKRFYPVIVTIEGFLKHPVLDVYFDKEMKSRGLLVADAIAPLSMVEVEEIEAVEGYGLNLLEALRSWHESDKFPFQPLGDYIVSSYKQAELPPNQSALGRFTEEAFLEAAELTLGMRVGKSGSPDNGEAGESARSGADRSG